MAYASKQQTVDGWYCGVWRIDTHRHGGVFKFVWNCSQIDVNYAQFVISIPVSIRWRIKLIARVMHASQFRDVYTSTRTSSSSTQRVKIKFIFQWWQIWWGTVGGWYQNNKQYPTHGITWYSSESESVYFGTDRRKKKKWNWNWNRTKSNSNQSLCRRLELVTLLTTIARTRKITNNGICNNVWGPYISSKIKSNHQSTFMILKSITMHMGIRRIVSE